MSAPRSHALVEHPPCPATSTERVDYVFGLMLDMKWERGRTAGELAKAWGLTQSTIENYSCEATRRVKAQLADPDATAADAGIILRRAIQGAYDEKKWRDVIKGVEVISNLTGAVAPTRVRVGEDPPAKMSEAELMKLLPEAMRVAKARGIAVPSHDEQDVSDSSGGDPHDE